MIHLESILYLERNLSYFTRMPEQEDLEEGMDELWGCCGQLLATNHKCEHMLCDGVEEVYRVGGLSIELWCTVLFFPHSKSSASGLCPSWSIGLCLWGMQGHIHF